MNKNSFWVVIALVALGLTATGACASTSSTSDAKSVGTNEPVQSLDFPETTVGQQMRWIADLLNGDAAVTEAEIEEKFSGEFLREVPPSDVVVLINEQLRPARPFQASEYNEDGMSASMRMEGTIGAPFEVLMDVGSDSLIEGLLFRPVVDRTAATSLEEIEQRLSDLPFTVRALVTIQSVGGEVDTAIALDPQETAPLASVFKLYVLRAVAQAVEQGSLSWEDTVTVTDTARSLPSGSLQDAAEGTEVSVKEAARVMISESDNTATDLLIGKVGRDAVEATVVEVGHHDPSLLRPFLSTKNIFEIGWGNDPALAEQWYAADEDGRRAIVEELDGKPVTATVSSVTDQAVWMKDLDWFASAQDIAGIHEVLAGIQDPVVGEALSENPGIGMNFDREVWPRIYFKGGSSSGVLTGSWRAERSDGTILTVVMLGSSDNAQSIAQEQAEFFGLAEDIFRVVGESA